MRGGDGMLCLQSRGLNAATEIRCSTIGPSASAGTNVSAPTETTVPMSSTTNSGPCVGSVPAVTGHALLGGE